MEHGHTSEFGDCMMQVIKEHIPEIGNIHLPMLVRCVENVAKIPCASLSSDVHGTKLFKPSFIRTIDTFACCAWREFARNETPENARRLFLAVELKMVVCSLCEIHGRCDG